MLGVHHLSKATNTTTDRDAYCCFRCIPAAAAVAAVAAVAAAAASSSAAASGEVKNICTAEGVFEGGGLYMKKQ